MVSYSDWEQGTGFWLKDSMDNSPGALSNSVIPWMMGMKLYTCVEFHKMEERYLSGIDLVEYRQMLYQVLQFTFDWGYDTVNKYFYYSAAIPSIDGGENTILSPLTWIYIKYKEDLAAGRISNPEWFDDALWKSTILHFYAEKKQTGKGLYRHGFYGYELIFPHEFWTDALIVEAE